MQEFSDLTTYFSLSPSQLANSVLHCPECSRDHSIPFPIVQAGHDLIDEIPDRILETIGHPPQLIGVIYDRHIEEKLQTLFFEEFEKFNLCIRKVPIGYPGQLLDAAVEIGNEVASSLPDNLDLLIGVGSGVISDLTKWIATHIQVPYFLVATAASMNAYTSITGSMTENHVKISKWLDPAAAVFLDSELLGSAPLEMTCAGIGDLLARNVANADWKLSEIIRGTYFCPVPYQMMASYQDAFLSSIDTLANNDRESMPLLGDAVILSGYSMTVLNGETSPSSGSEHILSHFFDFQHDVFNLPKNLHGTQVGIGTIIMSTAFDVLKDFTPEDFDLDDLEHRCLSKTALKLDHKRVFGDYGIILDCVVSQKRVDDLEYRAYMKFILDNWVEIWNQVSPYLMQTRKMLQAMEKAGAVTTISGIHRTEEEVLSALIYGANYRSRYTILDLFWELGLFPKFAPVILEKSGVLG